MTPTLTNEHRGLRSYWHPVATSSEVAVATPVRVVLLGDAYVLWRTPDDAVVAFPDACPHRGAPLSTGAVVDGALRCAYHGWCFDTVGACTYVPALGPGATVPPAAALRSVSVHEAHGLVFLAPEGPRAPLLEISEWDDPALRQVWLPPVVVRTSAGQFLDNFCDFGHFPFVHPGTFGAGEDALVGEFDLLRTERGYRLVYDHVAEHHEDPGVLAGERPLLQPRSMTYTYQAPFSALLRIEYPLAGTVNAIATWVQPVDRTASRVYTCMLRNDVHDDAAAADAVAYELRVLDEDIALLERLDGEGLVLDPRAQVHTRADRCTLELRRCLAEAIGDR